jgi:Outer membrane protein beta-barrel domain
MLIEQIMRMARIWWYRLVVRTRREIHESEATTEDPEMRVRRTMFFTVLAVAWIAAPAQAQWIVTPYVGINVAGDLERRRGGAGVYAGYIGDWVAFEFDVERHGHFFKDAEIGNTGTALTEDVNTRATRIMGNVLVPLHRRGATGWRLYGAAGFGLVRADFIHLGQSPEVVRADSNNEGPREVHQGDFAFNAGGGAIKSLNSRLGLRADLRYFRAFADQNKSLPAGQIGDVNGVYRDYGFWQVTFGVTFRFPRER